MNIMDTNEIQVHVLASGSSGNSTLLRFGGTNILVDAGISTRRIKTELAAVGVDLGDVNGVVITHEHNDHVNGLATMTKKYEIPVFMRPAAWENFSGRSKIPAASQRELPRSLTIGDVRIEPFAISHDAADPVGFSFYYREIKCCVATDLGFASTNVTTALAMADAIVLEANHDIGMVKNGPYPWFLKQRILSNRGHLSNIDAAGLLTRLQRRRKTQVLLAHLSQENNRPQLALDTVSGILELQGCREEFDLHLTHPNLAASVSL